MDAGGAGRHADLQSARARIQVAKSDTVTDGAINEAPVQGSLADDDNLFRVVDCKYMYNLSIPSLKGTAATVAGTYRVEIGRR